MSLNKYKILSTINNLLEIEKQKRNFKQEIKN